MERITNLQQIKPYEGPQWLVDPGEYDTLTGYALTDEIAIVEQSYTVLDRHVQGWGDYNAIIRFDDGAYRADYLARLDA